MVRVLLIFALFGLASGTSAAETPLSTAAEIRGLSPEKANEHQPIRTRGVVTHFAPPLAYLQDETGAIYFSPGDPFRFEITAVALGDYVEIEGVSGAGRFAPVVQAPTGKGDPVKITVLGASVLPEPVNFSLARKFDLNEHNVYGKLHGIVREVSFSASSAPQKKKPLPHLRLVLSTIDGEIEVVISEGGADKLPLIQSWIGSEIEVYGIRGVTTEARSLTGITIAAQSIDALFPNLQIIDEAFQGTPKSIAALPQFHPDFSSQRRILVHGAVTLALPGRGVYLAETTYEAPAAIFLATTQRSLPPAGTVVAAIGFLQLHNQSANLADAIIRPLGSIQSLEPTTVTAQEALSGKLRNRLIRIDAIVQPDVRGPEGKILGLEAEGIRFMAEVANGGKHQNLEAGSRVRIVGLCLNESGDSNSGIADSFSMLVPSAEGVSVLTRPNWWTASRLFAAGAGLLVALLSALTWGLMLRRRVAEQTKIITAKVQTEAVSQERNRVARELHDTLEQQLSGVALQLDGAEEIIYEDPAAASKAVSVARRMLRHTRIEARRSVWDLRSRVLEQEGLAAAISAIIKTASGPNGPAVHGRFELDGRILPRSTQFHLLRIAQEALANAIKHSAAQTISVTLQDLEAVTQLSIRDDGCGLTSDFLRHSNGAHFGVQGMQERAAKIGATLTLEGTPGEGSLITVTIPSVPPSTL